MTFIFTRAVRAKIVTLITRVGSVGGPGTYVLGYVFGADLSTVAVGGFVLFVISGILAAYVQGLQARKDKEID